MLIPFPNFLVFYFFFWQLTWSAFKINNFFFKIWAGVRYRNLYKQAIIDRYELPAVNFAYKQKRFLNHLTII